MCCVGRKMLWKIRSSLFRLKSVHFMDLRACCVYLAVPSDVPFLCATTFYISCNASLYIYIIFNVICLSCCFFFLHVLGYFISGVVLVREICSALFVTPQKNSFLLFSLFSHRSPGIWIKQQQTLAHTCTRRTYTEWDEVCENGKKIVRPYHIFYISCVV